MNVTIPSSIQEVQKSQTLRIIDVFVFAPFLIYYSLKQKPSKLDKALLIILGTSIAYYNGMNYLKNKSIDG